MNLAASCLALRITGSTTKGAFGALGSTTLAGLGTAATLGAAAGRLDAVDLNAPIEPVKDVIKSFIDFERDSMPDEN